MERIGKDWAPWQMNQRPSKDHGAKQNGRRMADADDEEHHPKQTQDDCGGCMEKIRQA